MIYRLLHCHSECSYISQPVVIYTCIYNVPIYIISEHESSHSSLPEYWSSFRSEMSQWSSATDWPRNRKKHMSMSIADDTSSVSEPGTRFTRNNVWTRSQSAVVASETHGCWRTLSHCTFYSSIIFRSYSCFLFSLYLRLCIWFYI